MPNSASVVVCKHHSGFEHDIAHLKDNTDKQWTAIDSIRKMMLLGLGFLVANLLGVIITILLNLNGK